ncbi:DEAD/DEAH box helicase family protein [Isoptericola croceus]|uniref:DEAD/DEAH box helicase family protein n=1 Tax=Isoptericola croceus TaxID=3031406 RepID=UPI0023F63CA1|nr:DEAD/DEAH box helicase family protein [Isoptericola croceus]
MTKDRPLQSWEFRGTLRQYQHDILETLRPTPGDPLHVVAPPGAGKTLVGLLLAVRDGRRAIALAPTTTIRHQWATTAAQLADDGAVSEDPGRIADVTALTYQALSVVQAGDVVGDLARVQWIDELVTAGRSEAEAEAFLTALERDNGREYRAGVRRRNNRLRRELVRADPAQVVRVLHPSARELVDRIVAAGVQTIVLDECHHLLDHWAMVIGYLISRIREDGGEPLVIGLTATLPSPDDGREYENYTGLLGSVDYEIPTPAVVREGNLAPYRDLVWFTAPTDDELTFLDRHESRLQALVTDLLSTREGTAFLVDLLQPDTGVDDSTPDDRLGQAFEEDLFLAEPAARMLWQTAPGHPVVDLLPPPTRRGPGTADSLVLLGRFALRRLLTAPDRADEWERVRATLADFGYQLTDRGIRRGRDPVDQVLAHSAAKDSAAAQILRQELAGADGGRVRAVVVCDFAVHGNKHGREGAPPAGALRTFSTLVADPVAAGLCPVLLTAQHLRVATEHADEVLSALRKRAAERTGDDTARLEPTPHPDEPAVTVVETSLRPSVLVAAVSDLVTDGVVRLLVGTRGLLGEGWDCPAVNTLIDLTAVATASATQQLRGRTLRLDPSWPGKVAHNWGVACLAPQIDATRELNRVRRRHDGLWGLSTDDDTSIVRGVTHSLTQRQVWWLDRIVRQVPSFHTTGPDQLNDATLARLPARVRTYEQWRVGAPYVGTEQEVVRVSEEERAPAFTSPGTLALALALIGALASAIVSHAALAAHPGRGAEVGSWLVPAALGCAAIGVLWLGGGWRLARDAWRTIRRRALPGRTYAAAAHAVVDTLHAVGRIPRAFAHGQVVVAPIPLYTGTAPRDGAQPSTNAAAYTVTLTGGTIEEQRTVMDAVAELFGPVTSPRFLLRTGNRPRGGTFLEQVADRLVPPSEYVPVPKLIGRRRDDARRFAKEWDRQVGRCTLIEVSGRESLAVVSEARRQTAVHGDPPVRGTVWY